MKKLLPYLIVLSFFFSLTLSCNKSIDDPKVINDTIYQIDTIFLRDTIQNFDTLFIFDTIIYNDTVVVIDTIFVQDTSAFSYLFKHYELESYDVLFYTIDKQKSPRKICTMKSDAHLINILEEGNKMYPVWAPQDDYIFYVDLDNLSIAKRNLINGEVEHIYQIDRPILFLRYFPAQDLFLVSYEAWSGNNQIGAIDYHNNQFYELSSLDADEYNPTCSEVDDWIYFSRTNNGTADIFRRKLDGSSEEEVYIDPEFNLSTFSVSADGKFLITPKYRNGKGYIVFYDINRHRIIHELDLPVEGHPMYASLSKDNRAIFFVNGTPYNYTEPRNIYRMGLDKTQLFQMTTFTDQLASRPLIK